MTSISFYSNGTSSLLGGTLMMALRYTSTALGLFAFMLIGLTLADRAAEAADAPQPGIGN
jgi:hypothetical protein